MPQYNRNMIAGERLPFIVDVSNRSVEEWTPNSNFAANTLARPTDGNANGFMYQNAVEGKSGLNEPSWVASEGANTQDGSLNWTALVPPSSEDTVASAVWIQLNPPDGALLINGQTIGDVTASAFLGGGTSGQKYVINATVTMISGAIYIAQIVLSVQ